MRTARLALLSAFLLVGCMSPEAEPGRGDRLVCARVADPPAIDGSTEDAAWASAAPLRLLVRRVVPPNEGVTTEVELRAVHTDTHVCLLARWRDESKDDVFHKPWVWNADTKAYEEGPDREDMFSIAFEHTGVFDPDMLSGEPAVWDVWQWKATRTNPQGYAMDRIHRYTLEKPEGKAKTHAARNGTTIWIARPEDEGDTVERKQPAPKEHREDRVPQYLPGTPTGSAADVRAKGSWADGWWTLEFERKLDTGSPDDTAFDASRAYRMAVGAHDRTGDMDKASGALELCFE